MMAVDAQGNEIGKLFVGGLHQSTTNESLKSYFSKFGDIEESVVMMDNRTGRSRGFGYIKFKENTSVDSVLSQKPHVVDHKEVDPKRCNVNMKGKNRRSLKVFVGGLAFEHDEATIRSFFSNFGRVTDVNLLTSPNKQRHRGFAFVGFDDEEVVRNLIRLHFLNLNGKQVEVKAMEPPIAQRPGYPLPQGCHPQMQTNGRAVRGGRSNFAQMQPNDSYAHYNQWPGVNPNSWNPAAGPPGPPGSQPWAQQPVSWNGAGPANHPGNQTGNGHSAHLSNLAAQPGMPWPPDQTGPSANGWMSSAWGPQVQNSMSANNRMQSIGEDVSLYNSSQNRKPRPTWDALCFAALTGTNSASNQNDLVGSLETWNHPAAAAAAATNALCQLTPMQIGPGNAPSTDWSQVAGTPGNSAAAHWMGMNSTPVSLAGSNASEGVTSNLTSGYLNDHSAPHPHQNGATLAAVAAAFGIGGSGAAPVPPHWTASGPSGDPNSMKLEDSIYRSSTNCGLSVPNTPGTMQHPNGLISGDWRTAATPVAGFHTAAVTPQATHQHLYKR